MRIKIQLRVKKDSCQGYLLERRTVNIPRGPFGGVRADDGLGVESLILSLDAFLFTIVRGFFGCGGIATALCLPARVQVVLALGSADESSVDLALGV
jgi:hypothetical protein